MMFNSNRTDLRGWQVVTNTGVVLSKGHSSYKAANAALRAMLRHTRVTGLPVLPMQVVTR